MNRLIGKVALITGGANGQGAAEAKLFASEGAKVFITDIQTENGRRFADELRAANLAVMFLQMDVTRDQEWEQVIRAIVEQEKRIDILVNNAGIAKAATVEETTDDLWEQLIAVNQKGVFLGMRHAVPVMKTQKSGSIINVSSIAGIVGSRTGIAYGASKGAVRYMTKSSALELAPYGIRVNSIIPGPIDTEMLRGLQHSSADHVPLGRLGTSEDVAYGALYLASDESSFVTGIDLVIDGGFTTGTARKMPV